MAVTYGPILAKLHDAIVTSKKYARICKKHFAVVKRERLVFNYKEVKSMLKLSEEYLALTKKGIRSEQGITLALNILFKSTSYIERLTAINNALILLSKSNKQLLRKVKELLQAEPSFIVAPKNVKDSFNDGVFGQFAALQNRLDDDMEIVKNTLEYINKLQFNLKTLISVFKALKESDHDQESESRRRRY